jgi:hypothetical protein
LKEFFYNRDDPAFDRSIDVHIARLRAVLEVWRVTCGFAGRLKKWAGVTRFDFFRSKSIAA